MLGGGVAAAAGDGPAGPPRETPTEIFAAVLRQSIGAPARADIGDQATERLSDDLILVPGDVAVKVLKMWGRPFPADIVALLMGAEGVEAPGYIRVVPAGFIDADTVTAWSDADLLASLDATVARGNTQRVKQNLQPLEARRWVLPPHYNQRLHQLTWAALVLPKTEPRESDGVVSYHAVGFGRDGYIELMVVSDTQKVTQISHMMELFLAGLNFRPGKAYDDAVPADKRAPAGLAGVVGADSLRKATENSSFLAGDRVVPVAGSIVAAIGGLSLLVYVRRHLRRQARRI